MTDYWLSKLFFDIQAPANLAKWKADRESVLQDYPLSAEMRAAVLADDLEAIAPPRESLSVAVLFQHLRHEGRRNARPPARHEARRIPTQPGKHPEWLNLSAPSPLPMDR